MARLLLAFACLLIRPCSGGETYPVFLEGPPPADEIVLPGVADASAVVSRSDGTLLVLDDQSVQVHRVDAAGTHLGSFGGPGSGPGELRRPVHVAVVGDHNVVVERGGSFHVFDAEGGHQRTHRPGQIIAMNSSSVGYADTLLAVGGHISGPEPGPTSGLMLHVHTLGGDRLGSSSNVSELSRRMGVGVLFGMHCDADGAVGLVCAQITDHALLEYGPLGEDERRVPLASSGARPLTQPQPERSGMVDWMTSFDAISCVFVVDNQHVVVCFSGSGGRAIELVRREDGQVLKRRALSEKLLHYDRRTDTYYLEGESGVEVVEARLLSVTGREMWGS